MNRTAQIEVTKTRIFGDNDLGYLLFSKVVITMETSRKVQISPLILLSLLSSITSGKPLNLIFQKWSTLE